MSDLKIIISGDGSSTIYNEHLNETYHSQHGAITESIHIFIKHGLEQVPAISKEIRILEIGLGTGLNALLSLQYSFARKNIFYYHTLEPFPLQKEMVQKLNYEKLLNDVSMKASLDNIHEAAWGEEVQLQDNFKIHKHLKKLEDFETSEKFDLIYFDAFAPSKQPEIWCLENFVKIFEMMNSQALLVSYCASGQFKRDLKTCGFTLETLSGPPGKKEMTRARKP
jgi:tRNA U34 5-methylaminomethyl-2-thiouridine-forming methyltransferase MnmC